MLYDLVIHYAERVLKHIIIAYLRNAIPRGKDVLQLIVHVHKVTNVFGNAMPGGRFYQLGAVGIYR